MKKSNEEQIQKKYVEFQILVQNINQVQKYAETVEEQIVELNQLTKNLDELNKVKKGTGILVPLGQGIFTKANVNDLKKLYTNVGANVVVTKTIHETKNTLKKQQEGMQNLSLQLQSQLQELSDKQKELTESIQSLDNG